MSIIEPYHHREFLRPCPTLLFALHVFRLEPGIKLVVIYTIGIKERLLFWLFFAPTSVCRAQPLPVTRLSGGTMISSEFMKWQVPVMSRSCLECPATQTISRHQIAAWVSLCLLSAPHQLKCLKIWAGLDVTPASRPCTNPRVKTFWSISLPGCLASFAGSTWQIYRITSELPFCAIYFTRSCSK